MHTYIRIYICACVCVCVCVRVCASMYVLKGLKTNFVVRLK